MLEFLHVGVPTRTKQPNETHVEGLGVFITSPEEHDMKFEYLRFEANSPLPKVMQEKSHVAYKVDSIEKYAQGAQVIVEPFAVDPKTRIAFIIKDDVIFELMEVKG